MADPAEIHAAKRFCMDTTSQLYVPGGQQYNTNQQTNAINLSLNFSNARLLNAAAHIGQNNGCSSNSQGSWTTTNGATSSASNWMNPSTIGYHSPTHKSMATDTCSSANKMNDALFDPNVAYDIEAPKEAEAALQEYIDHGLSMYGNLHQSNRLLSPLTIHQIDLERRKMKKYFRMMMGDTQLPMQRDV